MICFTEDITNLQGTWLSGYLQIPRSPPFSYNGYLDALFVKDYGLCS